METRRNNGKQEKTKYIQLDTRKCEACWKCMEECSHDVFGKINILWHKHIHFINADNCIGCLKCIKVCTSNALTRISINK